METTTTISASPCDTVFMPYVGQIFRTVDKAFEYYSTFTRKNGFSISESWSTKSLNLVFIGEILFVITLVSIARKKANVEHSREHKSVQCECDAKLYLTKNIVD